MDYKDILTHECVRYHATNNKVKFIGYNTAKGSRMYGSLKDIPESDCIESPVAENLMMGMAIGMALDGMRPVVCFERHDFLLLALDALVNHIDKLPQLSGYQYKLPIIVRAIVGAVNPLNPGVQHTMDYSRELSTMLKNTPVYVPRNQQEFKMAWNEVGNTPSGAVVIVEYRDWYDKNINDVDKERG